MPTDFKTGMAQWLEESSKKMKKEFKPILKKLKHLRTTFIQFVDERSIGGAWTEELEKDFEIIESLETDLNIQKRLLPGDMKLCNKLYKKYKVIYDKI